MKRFHHRNNQKGFTLVETIIAILILSVTVGSLLTLASGGFFSVRYARNKIVADNLIQESIEYIRNSRDSLFQQNGLWANWMTALNVDASGNASTYTTGSTQGCFGTNGCIVDPFTSGAHIKACTGTCPAIVYYADEGVYAYASGPYPFSTSSNAYQTTYVRKIKVTPNPSDSNQITVTATITWLDGTATKTESQSMVMTNWHP